ncbi:MAG: DUF5317 family protein [Coriobacteriia bacterium]
MILVEMIAMGLLLALLTGGSIKGFVTERLTGERVLLALFPLQLLWPAIAERLSLDCAAVVVVWVAMMVVLALVLFLNARHRWMLGLAALGVVSNVLVIALNGAMPVSIRAASELGETRERARIILERSCLHEELTDATRAPWLSDVIVVPGPDWHRSVISLGDILLGASLGLWAFAAAKRTDS